MKHAWMATLILTAAAPLAAQTAADGDEAVASGSVRIGPNTWVPLEVYIAGVVQAEMGWMSVQSFGGSEERRQEALRAQAIASRTYVLRHLERNGADAIIPLGPRFQAYNPDPSGAAIEAALATSGRAMTYRGELINAHFDSGADYISANGEPPSPRRFGYPFNTWDAMRAAYEADPRGMWDRWMVRGGRPPLEGDGYSWTEIYVTAHNDLEFRPTLQTREGPANRGAMGQLQSAWLAAQGYTTEEILAYFYTRDIRILHADVPRMAEPTAHRPLGRVVGGEIRVTWADLGAERYQVESRYYARDGWRSYHTWTNVAGTEFSFHPSVARTTYILRVRPIRADRTLGPATSWISVEFGRPSRLETRNTLRSALVHLENEERRQFFREHDAANPLLPLLSPVDREEYFRDSTGRGPDPRDRVAPPPPWRPSERLREFLRSEPREVPPTVVRAAAQRQPPRIAPRSTPGGRARAE